ncbi:MAG TPA: universal stress protein [Burkholderiales bacterium]|nr:universal stress protein [Burkholderiales bacterium]
MTRKVLIAYDGTREGREGLFQFMEVVPLQDAEIHLLAVVRIPTGMFLAEGYVPEPVLDQEKQRVQDIVDEGVKLLTGRGFRAAAHLAYGEPIEEIVKMARALPAQLIVIGHKRQTSFASRWWKSSVGKSLIELSPCSILVAVCD